MQQDQNASPDSLQKLQDLLQKLFRADAADLTFGIYRIINQRRKLIEDFIDQELPAEINKVLDTNAEIESDREEIESLAKDIRQTLGDNVLDADGNLINETYRETPLVQKYLKAQEQVGSPQTRDQRADVVFNHLYTFFSRYYDNGDFIPRRHYSQTERYAVPYNGEEIYLHWANRVTLLKKHLRTYTRRNTADFFIHKDLKQFLKPRT